MTSDDCAPTSVDGRQFLCTSTPNLFIREAMVTDIIVGKNDNVEGVKTFFGMEFHASAVVLTTGTFMNGKIWVGRASMAAGRAGESASVGLTENLQALGFETDRLKTGTPARVDVRTVDLSKLEPQPGDVEVQGFSCPFEFVQHEGPGFLSFFSTST